MYLIVLSFVLAIIIVVSLVFWAVEEGWLTTFEELLTLLITAVIMAYMYSLLF